MKLAGIVVFVLVFRLVASGQQAIEVRLTDSSEAKKVVILDPGLSLGRATVLLPSFMGIDASVRPHSFSFLRNDFGSVAGGMFQEPVDLTSPFRLQREKEKRLLPLMVALGAIEAGAVGYMAYQHIRKYGFLK
jgi:hypothetical protein